MWYSARVRSGSAGRIRGAALEPPEDEPGHHGAHCSCGLRLWSVGWLRAAVVYRGSGRVARGGRRRVSVRASACRPCPRCPGDPGARVSCGAVSRPPVAALFYAPSRSAAPRSPGPRVRSGPIPTSRRVRGAARGGVSRPGVRSRPAPRARVPRSDDGAGPKATSVPCFLAPVPRHKLSLRPGPMLQIVISQRGGGSSITARGPHE